MTAVSVDFSKISKPEAGEQAELKKLPELGLERLKELRLPTASTYFVSAEGQDPKPEPKTEPKVAPEKGAQVDKRAEVKVEVKVVNLKTLTPEQEKDLPQAVKDEIKKIKDGGLVQQTKGGYSPHIIYGTLKEDPKAAVFVKPLKHSDMTMFGNLENSAIGETLEIDVKIIDLKQPVTDDNLLGFLKDTKNGKQIQEGLAKSLLGKGSQTDPPSTRAVIFRVRSKTGDKVADKTTGPWHYGAMMFSDNDGLPTVSVTQLTKLNDPTKSDTLKVDEKLTTGKWGVLTTALAPNVKFETTQWGETPKVTPIKDKPGEYEVLFTNNGRLFPAILTKDKDGQPVFTASRPEEAPIIADVSKHFIVKFDANPANAPRVVVMNAITYGTGKDLNVGQPLSETIKVTPMPAKPGEYDVTIVLNGKEYGATLTNDKGTPKYAAKKPEDAAIVNAVTQYYLVKFDADPAKAPRIILKHPFANDKGRDDLPGWQAKPEGEVLVYPFVYKTSGDSTLFSGTINVDKQGTVSWTLPPGLDKAIFESRGIKLTHDKKDKSKITELKFEKPEAPVIIGDITKDDGRKVVPVSVVVPTRGRVDGFVWFNNKGEPIEYTLAGNWDRSKQPTDSEKIALEDLKIGVTQLKITLGGPNDSIQIVQSKDLLKANRTDILLPSFDPAKQKAEFEAKYPGRVYTPQLEDTRISLSDYFPGKRVVGVSSKPGDAYREFRPKAGNYVLLRPVEIKLEGQNEPVKATIKYTLYQDSRGKIYPRITGMKIDGVDMSKGKTTEVDDDGFVKVGGGSQPVKR